MKIRGERECQACGTQWSYYETGSITCPECGSMRSVGVDERTEHTDNPAELDLSPVTGAIDAEPIDRVAERAVEQCREYVRKRGFIRGGELRHLDPTFVAAVELQHVASELARSMRVGEDEELYFLALVRGAADGQRPAPDDVPDTLAAARGLATAAVIDAYRRDLTRYLTEHPDPEARTTMGRFVDHRKRIEALDGSIQPDDAETLLDGLAELSRYAAAGDQAALASARDRLDGLE
ncbi:DUF7117 family protein [Halapricum hydrolyticum]|uniref:TFIIB-type zinc ribbon-containing protein n=1 Tax=Halapricum hydrolyticum TaxID=2979991 RepID=A0AAE3I9R6_9EURY|nr:TFIIB-type zinc ribbon-containing protein [Halapricum hydrolyticum]MCU4717205.1 TFIIB-type zinc ribbon-containing protein [Halapricum hydrolyticum]MCU4726132.1 TFIIB-type zinc ribbon-containing protein [Halapricum hydrolyticum]